MKRLLFAFALLLFAPAALKAQLKEVVIDIYGNYSVIVEVGHGVLAEVSEYGELLDIYGRQTRPHDRRNDRRRHRPGRFPGVDIEYYSNIWGINAGKVEKIGSIRFDYYSDIWGGKSGKLSRVGTLYIDYYSDIWGGKSGKVSDIGPSIRIDYYKDFYEEKSGLLQDINNYRYDYSFPPVPARHNRPSNHGPVIRGRREVRIGDITVIIVNRL